MLSKSSNELFTLTLFWFCAAAILAKKDTVMGYFRFHRSKQILPGVRLNLAKTGPSVSLGVPGARVNLGPQGVRTTVGIPGSGLSYITRSNSGGKTGQSASVAASSDPLAFMDTMSNDEKQALVTAQLKDKSIPRLHEERRAFETVIANHTDPLSEAEQADAEWMRTAYQRAITTKWKDFGYACVAVLVAVCAVPVAMTTENYWVLGGFIGSPIAWACSPPGRRSPLMLLAAILAAAGLFIVGLIALIVAILVFKLK